MADTDQPISVTNYDSENELLPPPAVSANDDAWLEDPDSPWTIEIETVPEDSDSRPPGSKVRLKKALYVVEVAKGTLATGDRRCQYFAKVFQNNFAEKDDSTSRIKLHELASRAFPIMIDYMSQNPLELQIATHNATALIFLAKYFDNPRLLYEARNFVKRDMNVTTCQIYANHATVFQIEDIMEAAARECSSSLSSSYKEIAKNVGIPLLLRILEKCKAEGKCKLLREGNYVQYCMSYIVAGCLVRNQHCLDKETFLKATSREFLPTIHHQTAHQFLAVERVVPGASQSDSLSDLQQRCIEAYKSNRQWVFRHDNKQEIKASLRTLSPFFLAELFESVAF